MFTQEEGNWRYESSFEAGLECSTYGLHKWFTTPVTEGLRLRDKDKSLWLRDHSPSHPCFHVLARQLLKPVMVDIPSSQDSVIDCHFYARKLDALAYTSVIHNMAVSSV